MLQTYDTATIDKHELDRLIEQADRQAAQQGYLSRTTSFNGEVMTVEWHKALVADLKAKLANDITPKQVIVKAIIDGQQAIRTMGKLQAFADRIKQTKTNLEAEVDKLTPKLDEIDKKAPEAFARAGNVIAQHSSDLDAMEAELRQLSNLPLERQS